LPYYYTLYHSTWAAPLKRSHSYFRAGGLQLYNYSLGCPIPYAPEQTPDERGEMEGKKDEAGRLRMGGWRERRRGHVKGEKEGGGERRVRRVRRRRAWTGEGGGKGGEGRGCRRREEERGRRMKRGI
jgi:hypothetical protein